MFMYTYKVMIHPNNKQETKIRRTLNKCIECNNIIYDYLDSFVKNKETFPKCSDVRKWFTVQKKIKDNEVISEREGMTKKEMIENHLDTLFYDVSNDALKQEIKDTYNSFIRFFKKLSKYPVKKEYQSYKKSFYVDPYKIEFTTSKVKLEKFYIVVAVDNEYAPKKKTVIDKNKTIGIDINIKSIVTSDNVVYETVTKTKNYKKAKKKFKRTQRKLSKRSLKAKELKKELRYSKNYQKIKEKWRKYKDRLLNLRDDHITRIITDIISLAPNKICVETLDVKSMKKRKKGKRKTIAQGIQENPFRKFLSTLEERLTKKGIQIIYADKWYPSSKKCNICGYIKSDLKLSDRVFVCPNCGLKINRDYNAAINLNNKIKKNRKTNTYTFVRN